MNMEPEIIPWPHQPYAVEESIRLITEDMRCFCVTSPTGGGKGLIIAMLIKWAVSEGYKVVLYTNRKLLVSQLCRVMTKQGINYGVRAAGYPDERGKDVQISSLPTENSRVLKKEQWEIHGKGQKTLVIVDECHLNSTGTAEKILRMHVDDGGHVVGFTATPIDIGHLYEQLIVAGTTSELRQCKALVRAYHYGPDEPDMAGFRPSIKTGEYVEKDVIKAIKIKCIFARVLEYYHKINPEQRPTILFGPGVAESIWLAQQFNGNGIRAAHIDGDGVWIDGSYNRGMERRSEVLQMVRSGEIKVLCNRYVLREGLDLPEVSHLILATVIGSLSSYLQAVGRGLRACPGKEYLTIQDHGGHWWRQGSVNIDRSWDMRSTENIIRRLREDDFREKKAQEPITCPECGLVRVSGPVCPKCGYKSSKKVRKVLQKDGQLKEHTGDIFKPRYVRMKSNTLSLWKQMYYRAKRSRNHMTFSQAEGLFAHENYYWPPRDLPFMPINRMDFFLPVADVHPSRLIQERKGES